MESKLPAFFCKNKEITKFSINGAFMPDFFKKSKILMSNGGTRFFFSKRQKYLNLGLMEMPGIVSKLKKIETKA